MPADGVSLEVLTERLAALSRSIDERLSAADRAVTKAEAATEKRFESVNNFRHALSDQATRFVTRDHLDSQVTALENMITSNAEANRARITILEKTAERQAGRGAGLAAGWGYIVTAFGLALTVATLIIIFTR